MEVFLVSYLDIVGYSLFTEGLEKVKVVPNTFVRKEWLFERTLILSHRHVR